MTDASYLLLYLLPLLLAGWFYVRHLRRKEAAHESVLQESREAGAGEPVCLHPVIDPVKCLGSGCCATACPENALGIVNGKAQLVNPSACIGHGACAAACPFDAITLVLGTESRGVDIPVVSPQFETSVPGIFVAGELGGMGMVRKAAEQGTQAVAGIRERLTAKQLTAPAGGHDLVIVGAGPAGMAAALAAKDKGLNYVQVDQEDSFGGTVYHYPRNKIVMTSPIKLPRVGKLAWTEISKERILDFWQGVITREKLQIRFNERLENITPEGDGFTVHTSAGAHRCNAVLLALGRRGTPRKLGVPGEEAAKVVYRLADAEQYRGRKVLVVGGGDAALEAALAVAAEPGTTVSLACRTATFDTARLKNRQRVTEAEEAGRLKTLMNTQVSAIEASAVRLDQAGEAVTLANDYVIVCAGGILPTPLLKQVGILIETKRGTA